MRAAEGCAETQRAIHREIPPHAQLPRTGGVRQAVLAQGDETVQPGGGAILMQMTGRTIRSWRRKAGQSGRPYRHRTEALARTRQAITRRSQDDMHLLC